MLLHIPKKSGVTSSTSTFLRSAKMEMAGIFFLSENAHSPSSRMTFSPISRWCINAAGCCPAIPLRSKHLPYSCPPLGMLATDIQLGTSLELLLHCHVPFLGTAYSQGLVNVTYKGPGPVPQPGSPRLRAAMGLAEAFLASALQFSPPLSALHLHIH